MISISPSTLGSASEGLQGEGIIPFPNEKKAAFVFFGLLIQKTEDGENRVISLSIIVDEDKKIGLYQNAVKLSQTAAKIREQLNKEYTYGQPLPKKLVAALEEWKQSIEYEEPLSSERKPVFDLSRLFDLFPMKKAFRSYEDPLLSLFSSLMFGIPVVLVGPDQVFLLEVTDVFRKYTPLKELDSKRDQLNVRLVTPPTDGAQLDSYKIPRGDVILLNEEQFEKSTYYNDPVIVMRVKRGGGEIKFMHYSIPDSSKKVIGNILKKSRGLNKEKASEYLEKEMTNFFTKLARLKKYTSARKRRHSISEYVSGDLGSLRESSKLFGVDEDYVVTLAESLRIRNVASATTLNKLFQYETDFSELTIQDEDYIGYVHK
ncbi:MAG: hypothetical protein ACFFDI_29830 [Promethearchaeota archaeon]